MLKKMGPAQEFVYVRSYARWLEDLKRRENWTETVDRYFSFFKSKFGDKVPKKVWDKCYDNVLRMKVMPSMRALWSAGPALESNNFLAYNCCALSFKDLQSVVELFYILMCGAGVGFSVEKQYIGQMPVVQRYNGYSLGTHVVGDSREGWAESLRVGLNAWFEGKDVEFDYSKVRPRGARLTTMGGRASGPDPLRRLHGFAKSIILGAQGRQLTSIEWLDIGNMVAEVVVVGGVRRSSEITFSDLNDDDMRHAKDWPFPEHRRMSNNSAVYLEKPDMVTFMKEWSSLAASGTGERGIFNLKAMQDSSPRREKSIHLRGNPCQEIGLRVDTGEMCNLSEVIVEAGDTFEDLVEKAKSAVWLGVMQACLTDFPLVRPSFKEMCEKERLLGVSLTGQMDNPRMMTDERLEDLRGYVIKEARKASRVLGINMPAAITCGKPSGSVSQMVNCSSGAHPRYAKHYIRRYRISATDPLYKMMKSQGVKFCPEVGQRAKDIDRKQRELVKKGRTEEEAKVLVPDWTEDQVMTWVCEFPEAAPKGAIVRHDVDAIEQLEWYLKLKTKWCEHNQSITVYVKKNEWLKVGAWVYDHFDEIAGVSFLPAEDEEIKYELAPYEEITKEKYEEMLDKMPKLDYSKLSEFEQEDNTVGAKTLACSADGCEMK